MKKFLRNLMGKMTPSETIVYPRMRKAKLTMVIHGKEFSMQASSNDIVNGRPAQEFEKVVKWVNNPNSPATYSLNMYYDSYIIVKDKISVIRLESWTEIDY